MNIWRWGSPVKWWRGHHYKYFFPPYSPTSDRVCRRCGKYARMRLEQSGDYWYWLVFNEGNGKCA